MKKISILFVLAYLTSLWINSSEEFRWISKPKTIQVCNGQTADLIWEFSDERNETSQLKWFFNNTWICIMSDTYSLKVNFPYQNRVEILGKSGIRLKHISPDDEGTFTLFPYFPWSTSTSMQTISLQVLVPPTSACSCNISSVGNPLKHMCAFSSPACGRPQITAVWKSSQGKEALSGENYIMINSTIHNKNISCYPQGIALDCIINSSHQFCESILVPDEESPSKTGSSSQERDTVKTKVPHSSDTDDMKQEVNIPLVCSIAGLVLLITAGVCCTLIVRKKCKMPNIHGDNRALRESSTDQEMQEMIPHNQQQHNVSLQD